MKKAPVSGRKSPIPRADLIRACILVILTILIWCSVYNRWSVQSWSTPIAYTDDPAKGDVIHLLAEVKAARDGHNTPPFLKIVPELGAPFEGNWNDYPVTERFQFYFAGVLARFIGIFAALNFAILMEYLLATLAFYAACRLWNAGWLWSFTGALIFSFSHFSFAHGGHHITVAYYWHIPLCLLVCGWVFGGKGIAFGEWRFYFALAVALVTGIQHPYYTNMFAQFVLFGALAQWYRSRDWKVVLPSMAIIGTSAAGFVLMNLNIFVYHFLHGPNPDAVDRKYTWLEIYALKIVDMIIPPPGHRFSLFSDWGLKHMTEVAISPGELPQSGYIGIIGILATIGLAVYSIRCVLKNTRMPLASWQVIWILLYSEVGGINGLIGTFGFLLFRATTRYSIFIDCIVLMFAVRFLSSVDFKKLGKQLFDATAEQADLIVFTAAFAVLSIGLWDQMPPSVSNQKIEEITALQNSDRRFTENMEQMLPPNTMIFQLPIMQFPESPGHFIGSYDHLRPYLYSKHLKYSFGSDKGRAREKWQQEVGQSASLNVFVDKLEQYGFGAIYLNRTEFPDHGENFIKGFKSIGRDQMIESEKGDLVCIVLKPSASPILPVAYGGMVK